MHLIGSFIDFAFIYMMDVISLTGKENPEHRGNSDSQKAK
jgi:hypothetical protein